jgi:predicted Zn finger-like uncharacterized protein
MKVQCPNCKTLYKMSDLMISDREMRVICPKCKTRFNITPDIKTVKDALAEDDAYHPSNRKAGLKKEKKIVVGFWFRLLADVLDTIFLAIFGYFVIIRRFWQIVYILGDAGILIGLCVAFLYFGLLQSSIGNGQSLAKKILKIQVLKMDGSYMRLSVSFLRYAVIACIFYGHNIWDALVSVYPQLEDSLVISESIFALFIFLSVGTIILVAFHPLKRGLHDLIAGTVVVRLGRYDKDKIKELASPHRAKKAYLAVSIVCVLIISGSMILKWMLIGKIDSPTASAYITHEESVALKEIETSLEEETAYDSVVVTPMNVILTFRRGETETDVRIKLLYVKARISPFKGKPINLQNAVSLISQGSTYLENYDCINFMINKGINIGIFNTFSFASYEFTPAGYPVEVTSNMVRIPPQDGAAPTPSPSCHVEKQAIGDFDPQGGYRFHIVPMVPRPLDKNAKGEES